MNLQSIITYQKIIKNRFISKILVWSGLQAPGFAGSSFAKQWAHSNKEKQGVSAVNKPAEQRPQDPLDTSKAEC
ncbi:MAG: hypothetical protein HRT35_02235 [Algicola sp.]|nr:hypothetical protein [Algicola sp.]